MESTESPQTRYDAGNSADSIRFCPFEDVLGIGSKKGVTTILVPGAGEANPDSWQYNPYQTKKQRAETEVRMLLEKCQPETIALDPDILAKLDQNKIEGSLTRTPCSYNILIHILSQRTLFRKIIF